MKVLFLDIDGVVNCETTTQRHRGTIGIDPYMAFLVGKIVMDTECEVVLSSSWRHWTDGREEVERQVCRLFDVTPTIHGKIRGEEIEAWLMEHPDVSTYAILDDDDDMLPHQPHFKTDWKVGITPEIADAVTGHLGYPLSKTDDGAIIEGK